MPPDKIPTRSIHQFGKNHPRQNVLIGSLSEHDFEHLGPHLELVYVEQGEEISRPRQPLYHAYFPTTCVITLQFIMSTGAAAAITKIGNEGMLGLPLILGGNTTPSAAIVQTAGYAYRLDQRILKAEFDNAGLMQRLLLSYTQEVMTQIFKMNTRHRYH